MTKKQLIKLLSYHYPVLSVRVIQRSVDTILATMVSAFTTKKNLAIRDFGSFSTKLHKGKIIRHPTSRKLVKLKDHTVVHYKPSPKITKMLNTYVE